MEQRGNKRLISRTLLARFLTGVVSVEHLISTPQCILSLIFATWNVYLLQVLDIRDSSDGFSGKLAMDKAILHGSLI